jgi:L-aspartate oxidase
VWGVYAVNRRAARRDLHRAGDHARHRRGEPGLALFDQPAGATGDGHRHGVAGGCRVSNMEFHQFHPTCLYNPEVKNFLITEAMRGEGGQLKLPAAATASCPSFDSRAELAPRDIVARAIDHELKRLGLDYVHLDISQRDPAFIRSHFPTIAARWPNRTSASTSPASRSPSFPPRTTAAAACWSTLPPGPTWKGCMRPAR